MLIKAKNKDKDLIKNYIGKDYGKCLYIYIDIIKYSLDDNDDFQVWIQYDDNKKITALISEYYKGIQVYSKELDLDINEVSLLLKEKNPPIILGVKEVIDRLAEHFKDYRQEFGIIGQLKSLTFEPNTKAYQVDLSELSDIVKMVADDEKIGKPYGYDLLYKQYSERMTTNFGRNYVLRNDDNREIIAHAATYAEIPELAVIGGVITNVKYRRNGYSKGILASISKQLLDEGKDVFSFYYIESAIYMHKGVGFEKLTDWAKLVR